MNRGSELSLLLRRVLGATLSGTLVVIGFGGYVIAGLSASAATQQSRGPAANQTRTHPAPSPDQFVVAVVVGQSGTDTGDALAPYEVLGSSPRFFVYTAAANVSPAPLSGGLSIVPDFTFDEIARDATLAPDLIVVPAVNEPSSPKEQSARDFIVEELAGGSRVLGICAGSRLLAAAGVLDGRTATSHWSRISALEGTNPKTTWIRGQRYVQDGPITTSGGVTSGIPATLKVMSDLAGAEEAARVAALVDYPGWSLTASTEMPRQAFGFEDLPVLLNAMFPWGRPTLSIQLSDGVGEIDAAALFEVYAYSLSTSTQAISENGVVTTQHGMRLTTDRIADAIGAERVTIPLPSVSGGTYGYDAAFRALAETGSRSEVLSVSKMLEYPLDRIDMPNAQFGTQARPVLLGITGLIAALLLGASPLIVRRMRRRSPSHP